MFPEVVLFTETDDVIFSYAYFITPDSICFVVLFVNGGPELVLRNFKNLCEIFPSPRQSVLLEIIAEGEVSEHFKECAVTRRISDVFYIICTDTLLTGCHSTAGRSKFAREIFFKRSHSRYYEEKRLVVFRNERIAPATEMTLRLKNERKDARRSLSDVHFIISVCLPIKV